MELSRRHSFLSRTKKSSRCFQGHRFQLKHAIKMLDAQNLRSAHEKVCDRLTKKKEQQTVNQLVRGVFADVKFSADFPAPEKTSNKKNLFSTAGILAKKQKKKATPLHTVPLRRIVLVTEERKPSKTVKDLPKRRESPGMAKVKSEHSTAEENYENNWDIGLLDKVSENVAKWIVHEKFEIKDEDDYAQKVKLG